MNIRLEMQELLDANSNKKIQKIALLKVLGALCYADNFC